MRRSRKGGGCISAVQVCDRREWQGRETRAGGDDRGRGDRMEGWQGGRVAGWRPERVAKLKAEGRQGES